MMHFRPWLFLALLVGCAPDAVVVAAKVGEKIAPFDLPTLEGGASASHEWGGGPPIVLNFWATWCQPCLHEIPVLQELHRSGAAKVVSIALDQGGAPVIAGFVRDQAIDYPVLLGDLGLLQDLGSSSIPFTLVLDRELRVRKIHRSLVSARTLEQDLAAAR
jgi:thiol-disulfide isomerase/thioredoxin